MERRARPPSCCRGSSVSTERVGSDVRSGDPVAWLELVHWGDRPIWGSTGSNLTSQPCAPFHLPQWLPTGSWGRRTSHISDISVTPVHISDSRCGTTPTSPTAAQALVCSALGGRGPRPRCCACVFPAASAGGTGPSPHLFRHQGSWWPRARGALGGGPTPRMRQSPR